jgi:FtsP/CotA-like multicopper oxidase with cupredoxin domain
MSTFIWARRGRITAAFVALIAFALLAAIRSALATSGGDPYVVPHIVDTNPDPDIVETTIVAEPAMVDIGNGVLASVLTFNGSVPGPEFRLKVGDTVIVHFQNNIAHDTGIHWHGIELANASDGTPLTQNQVAPGDTFLYKFQVTRPGVFWYHPHHHSSTNQVFKGLYGSLVVTDPNEEALEAAGVIPGPEQTKTIVLTDVTVCKAVGANDAATYDPSLPHVSGAALPAQASPMPVTICETTPVDEDGNPRGAYNDGDVPNIQKSGLSGTVNEGQTVLTNGVNVGGRAGDPSAPGALAPGASLLDVEAGQGLRLQMINAATTRFFRLRLTDSAGALVPLIRIGGQGGLLDHAVREGGIVSGFDFKYGSGEILLDPGDRADVVAAIPPGADGPLTMWTQDFQRTGTPSGWANLPTVPVMHLNIAGVAASTYTIAGGTPLRAATGDPQEGLGAATATPLDPATFSPAKDGMGSQDITLTSMLDDNTPNRLGINGKLGSHDFTGEYTEIDHELSARFAASLGDTIELTVTNATAAHHPFHLHGFSIQPLDLTKPASPTYTFPYNEFRDNIDVPAGYTLRFRLRLDDRPLVDGVTPGGGLGRWVFHCHIFFHATFGMISEFVVVDPDGKERPYVNANDTLIDTIVGQNIQMAGTVVDTDGEAVTLTASIGTVVGDDEGHWTWTHTTAGGEPPFVYITAIDEGGRRDQAVFALNVNEPPVVTVDSAAGDEGAPIAVHATAIDPDGDPVTAMWSVAPGVGVDAGAGCTFAAPASLDTTVACTDDGVYTITLTASDGINVPVSKNATLTVANVAPSLEITSPPSGSVFEIGTPVAVVASITDPGSNDTLTCNFNWDGGGPPSSAPGMGGSCSKINTFTQSGVYTTKVTAVDDDGGSDEETLVIVVYDPNSKVLGAGTIQSPPGAYPANPSAHGPALFVVSARYPHGASVPVGEATFKVLLSGFEFRATSFEWLAVTGRTAQIKGTGTVGGQGGYRFLLTVKDGKVLLGLLGGKLRLKVWDASDTVVYDNAPGSPDDLDVANPRPISLGTIAVH